MFNEIQSCFMLTTKSYRIGIRLQSFINTIDFESEYFQNKLKLFLKIDFIEINYVNAIKSILPYSQHMDAGSPSMVHAVFSNLRAKCVLFSNPNIICSLYLLT